MHFPSQVRLIRSAPLPDGSDLLLRIAAGDEEATRTGDRDRRPIAGNSPRSRGLFCSSRSCSFRTPIAIGCWVRGRKRTNSELRRNMALLLRWLHPDLDPHGERSVFAARVTRAWNDLKTQERRAAYDLARRAARSKKLSFSKKVKAQSIASTNACRKARYTVALCARTSAIGAAQRILSSGIVFVVS